MTHDKPTPGQDLGAQAHVEESKPSENIQLQQPKNEQKLVDFGSDQSFPASDPPAHDIIKIKDDGTASSPDAGDAGSQ